MNSDQKEVPGYLDKILNDSPSPDLILTDLPPIDLRIPDLDSMLKDFLPIDHQLLDVPDLEKMLAVNPMKEAQQAYLALDTEARGVFLYWAATKARQGDAERKGKRKSRRKRGDRIGKK